MPSLITILWVAAAIAGAAGAWLVVTHRTDAPELPPSVLDLTLPPLPDRYRCQRWRVLVVTPRAVIGQQIAHMLQGHEVTVATCPEAAVAAVTQGREIDVILYTFAMPGRSGFAFAEQHPELRPCLVFLTESTLSPDVRRRLAGSGVPWVAQPLRYAALALAVDLAARMPRETPYGTGASGPLPRLDALEARASA